MNRYGDFGNAVDLDELLELPLRETVQAVLHAFRGSGINDWHLAAQIETQVRDWIRLNA